MRFQGNLMTLNGVADCRGVDLKIRWSKVQILQDPTTSTRLCLFFPPILPCSLCSNIAYQETHTLVVGRVQPEHTFENAMGLLEPAEAPEAQPEPMHASKERPVVDPTPPKQPVEVFAEG